MYPEMEGLHLVTFYDSLELSAFCHRITSCLLISVFLPLALCLFLTVGLVIFFTVHLPLYHFYLERVLYDVTYTKLSKHNLKSTLSRALSPTSEHELPPRFIFVLLITVYQNCFSSSLVLVPPLPPT